MVDECKVSLKEECTDSKVHGANMGPTWGREDPGGLHVGLMNLATWVWIKIGILKNSTMDGNNFCAIKRDQYQKAMSLP